MIQVQDLRLEKLGPHAFKDHKNLQLLFLVNTRLAYIDPHAFDGLINLNRLDLECDLFLKVFVYYFWIFNLYLFDLVNPDISHLDAAVFKDLKNSETLDLRSDLGLYLVLNYSSSKTNMHNKDWQPMQVQSN